MRDAVERIASQLTEWGAENLRAYPWRQTTTPYHLAAAEILLQKTKAGDAEAVWKDLTSTYRQAAELADAPREEITRIVGGLGLRRQRPQRLKSMADHLRNGWAGTKIPGLGSYGMAVIFLARDREPAAPPVDGNIARVVCRVFGFEFERGEPRKKGAVGETVAAILSTQREPQLKLRLVYALVDLGGAACSPSKPNCSSCPLAGFCRWASKSG